MRHLLAATCALGIFATGLAGAAAAAISPGQMAPAFTKNELAGGPPWSRGGPVSLSDYSGKVVVLFLLGYS